MGRLFGTDGVRGLANVDVTADLALDLSVAAAHVLGDVGAFGGGRPRVIKLQKFLTTLIKIITHNSNH